MCYNAFSRKGDIIPKIKIKETIINNGFKTVKELSGLIRDNKIIYKDNKNIITISLKDNKIVLTKASKEYKITINFIKDSYTECNYELIELFKTICLKVKTEYLKKTDDLIEIKYLIEDNKVNYKIEYEVI